MERSMFAICWGRPELLQIVPYHFEQRAIGVQLAPAPWRNPSGTALQVGKVSVVSAVTGRTLEFAADRTGGAAKAFSNGSDTALVVAHGHQDGPLLCRQMDVDFRHGSTLQQRVLHLVLETALSYSSADLARLKKAGAIINYTEA
jgi:hypothetical protein